MKLEQPQNPADAVPDIQSGSRGLAARFLDWDSRHPVLSAILVSLIAVVLNCYPVIFCSKSYVSPANTGSALVYDGWPSVPGVTAIPNDRHSVHGSDAWAIMYWGVPAGFIESRSLWEEHVLPLWNRYSNAGDVFLGQAITMLGDPLQLIVIFGHGSALAWDIKFLAAKFIFSLGMGLLVLRLTQNRALSLIFILLGAYCGAYFYIYSHPVFFVFSYAPWILLAVMGWLEPASANRVRWGLTWLLANFACFNAGHVETAVVLIGGLNLAGVAHALAGQRTRAGAVKVLARMALGAVCFLGLSAPVWVSFLVALQGAHSSHLTVHVDQMPLTMMLGIFDDMFYLLCRPSDLTVALDPGSSLLVLTGCCFSLSRWRQLKQETFFWINSGACLLWAGCVFSMVPASLLTMIPGLNKVGHLDTDISYLLVIHLTIQCAYGFSCLAKVERLQQGAGDIKYPVMAIALLFLLYSMGYPHGPIPWVYLLCGLAGAMGAPWLFILMARRGRRDWTIGWLGILILGFLPVMRFGFYNFGGINQWFILPGDRMTLNAPSNAIEKIKTADHEPERVVGMGWCLSGDYPAVYRLEDIRSCAPLGNADFFGMVSRFPGMDVGSSSWRVEVADPIKAQPLLNLLNVKYMLVQREKMGVITPELPVFDQSDFVTLENTRLATGVLWVEVVPIESEPEFIGYLMQNGRHPFIALTQTEAGKQAGIRQLKATGAADISPATNYILSSNSTEFDVHASAAGVVCLTEGQAKDFTAVANNEPKQVLTVNRAFKGIYLDKAGDYHVKFIYRPRYWRMACAVFWITAAMVGLLATAAGIHGNNRAKESFIS